VPLNPAYPAIGGRGTCRSKGKGDGMAYRVPFHPLHSIIAPSFNQQVIALKVL
jgi:hypothetical protein